MEPRRHHPFKSDRLLAKQCAFRHGNFETFAEPARQDSAFQKAKLSLDFTGSIKTKANYFAAMTDAVKADCPVLISVDNGNRTFHIQSVVEVEADKFRAYVRPSTRQNRAIQFDELRVLK